MRVPPQNPISSRRPTVMKRPASPWWVMSWAVAVCLMASFDRAQVPTTSVSNGQSPTFRAGVDVITFDVSVLDRDRRPIRGLTAADFTLLEDGKPRQVVAFSAVELPSMPAALTPSGIDTVPPDVVSNNGPQGRLVVILIDPFLERVMAGS